ncbi:SH3 domain-containing protein [Alcaligenaceae bacterium]|nr:SH3 domain-containing protein [Alcaligenaceae bacterium]
MNVLRLSVALATVFLACGAAHAQTATLIRDAELKQQPFTDAPTVSSLRKKTAVSIIANQGGWTQVKDANGQTGWVRLLNIRPDSPKATGGYFNSLSAMGNVARTGTTGVTATTGTKGISSDLLARATPNPSERKRMDQYRASVKSAQAYARTNKLQSNSLAWLKTSDAPPAPAGTIRLRGN